MWNVLHVAFTAILYSDVASDFFTDGDDDDDEDDEDNEEDNGDFSFSDMGSDDDDDDGDDIDDDALFELLWSYLCIYSYELYVRENSTTFIANILLYPNFHYEYWVIMN